jgi:nitroimidazol reductase NimA-like FMN-containing flavoprotein (pyridoxamine 5'-phosphate oxidase superfamily)
VSVRETRAGLEVLERAECLRLLARHEVGRLAVADGRHPTIFPVNYALVGDEVVFRTEAGMKLALALRGPVAFEIDEIDGDQRVGWSVVVLGEAEEVTDYDSAAVRALRELPLFPWAGGEKAHWVRIRPSTISGRRVASS